MRAFIILSLLFLSQEIFAISFTEISPNQPLCLTANYSPEYMQEHPRQKTSSVWMILSMRNDPQDPTIYMSLQLTLRQKVYRPALICDRKTNGSLHCAIECDGGQVELWPNGESATHVFLANHGLYLQAGCAPNDQPIFWEPSSGGDDYFDLELTACAN